MNAENISSHQSFGAKYIATTKIKEKLPFLPIYKNVAVDFVELKNGSDIDSIKDFAAHKANGSYLISCFLANLQNKISSNNYRAYVITRQQKNHEKLVPQKIIGLCDGNFTCDWRDDNIFFIDNLETLSTNNKYRCSGTRTISLLGFKFQIADKIKGVGKALLTKIITTMGDSIDSIQLESLESATSFYRHLGFKNDCLNPDYYRLPRKDFSKLLNMD